MRRQSGDAGEHAQALPAPGRSLPDHTAPHQEGSAAMVNAEIPLTKFTELASTFPQPLRKLNPFNAEPIYRRC
jgi:hypothetical protein